MILFFGSIHGWFERIYVNSEIINLKGSILDLRFLVQKTRYSVMGSLSSQMSSDDLDDYDIEEEIEKTNEELRNEWLQWIDERSKRYSIEPTIMNRFSKSDWTLEGLVPMSRRDCPDVYVYTTPYGILEFAENVVENYITKPVDAIIRSRARRDLILLRGFNKRSILINPRTSPVKKLTALSFNWKCRYTELCQDMYETYDVEMVEIDFLQKPRMSPEKLISFDEHTGELCLKIYAGSSWSKAGQLKFNLGIDKSRQQQIIDFVCRGDPSMDRRDHPLIDYFHSSHLLQQLRRSLRLLSGYHNLRRSFFQINKLEIPEDSTLFLNRNLTNLAEPFMKKIRQTLMNICFFLEIQVSGELAVNEFAYQAGSPIDDLAFSM